MMVALHFLQRIFASRSWTFSSAMEYLAPQEGQESFTADPWSRPPKIGRGVGFNELERSDYILAESAIYHAPHSARPTGCRKLVTFRHKWRRKWQSIRNIASIVQIPSTFDVRDHYPLGVSKGALARCVTSRSRRA